MIEKKFRTIEVSNPVYETNGLRFLTVKTENLKGRGDICVFIPTISDSLKDIPLVILLHGVYGSCWSWSMQGGVHLTAAKLMEEGKIPPMLIAMPSDGLFGDGSAYLPHNSFDFEKWIVEDIPSVMRQTFPVVTSHSSIFISGLSMGGFGALRIGAKYGALFKGISAHSSITSLEQMEIFVEEELFNYRQDDLHEEDVFKMMQKHRDTLPPFRFDCGKEDLLINQNRDLHERLLANGIQHSYEEYPGKHEWPYWQQKVVQTLMFFGSCMNQKDGFNKVK